MAPQVVRAPRAALLPLLLIALSFGASGRPAHAGQVDGIRAADRGGAVEETASAPSEAKDTGLEQALALRDSGDYGAALEALERLRQMRPNDIRLARLEAETHAWAGHTGRARELYAALAGRGDSLSMLGWAQMDAWRGDYCGAESRYRGLLAGSGTRPGALLGLARLSYWQGRLGLARDYLTAAEDLGASSGREWRRISEDVLAEQAPQLLATGRYQSDSDGDNWSVSQAGFSVRPLPDLRLEALGGLGQTARRARRYDLSRGEGAAQLALGAGWTLGARGGAERRKSSGTADTSAAGSAATTHGFGSVFLRADGGRWRLGLSAAAEHPSETPALVDADLGARSAGLDATWVPASWAKLEAGGSYTRYSDLNERPGLYAALRLRASEAQPTPGLGAIHRVYDDTHPSSLYFSPRRYRSDEAEASLEGALAGRRLHYLVRGSLGVQQLDDTPHDNTHSIKVDADFHPAQGLQLTLSYLYSNAAGQTLTAAPSPRFSWSYLAFRAGASF